MGPKNNQNPYLKKENFKKNDFFGHILKRKRSLVPPLKKDFFTFGSYTKF